MEIVIFIIVAVVAAQLFFDWRQNLRSNAIPRWLAPLAAGSLALSAFALVMSFGGRSLPVTRFAASPSRIFWAQSLFVAAAMALIAFSVRKRRPRVLLVLAAILLLALCLSFTLLT